MREETIARIYADALMQASEEKGERKKVLEELESLASLLDEHEDFRIFIESPQIDKSDKKKVIDKLFKKRFHELTLNFLGVLFEKNRQNLLRKIAREYRALDDEKEGICEATITSAKPVSAELEREFVSVLEKALGTRIRLRIEVNPRLLGGIIIRYRDQVLDGSVRKKLEILRDRIKAKRLMEGALYED
ncbi:MAG: ATP synthase F1 subunit delta [Candidatus Glassbacteria bacterium]